VDDDLDLAATHGLRHMSLPAAASSGLIHALAALALLWSIPAQPLEMHERAIDVTVELVTPPPAEQPTEPKPAPAAELLVPPPQPPPPVTAAEFPPPPQAPQQSFDPPPDVAEARVEDMLPPVDEPPPFSTAQLVKSVPAPAKPKPPPPLVKREPLQQAAALRVESERRAQEDYLLGVIQKLSRYRFTPQAREASEAGMVVTRVTVARDGRVLDVVLAKSSGFPNLDRGVIDTIRQASPFAPLPPEVADSQLSFIVPINYTRQR